jgi:predicted RNA-binding Zn ribbon-like protein
MQSVVTMAPTQRSVFSPPRTSLELAVALMNTWNLLAHPPELLRDPESLHRFLDWAGRPTDRPLSQVDLNRVMAARAVLRLALEAPNADQAVGLLNALAIQAGTVPQLRKVNRGWQFVFVTRDLDPSSALIGEAAQGSLDAIRDGDWELLGVCAGDPCRCVYVDRTKNRSRRYCCQLCTNRTTQARHRKRQRAQTARSRVIAAAASKG